MKCYFHGNEIWFPEKIQSENWALDHIKPVDLAHLKVQFGFMIVAGKDIRGTTK